jgi:RNA polymerase sigma-70 factor, ECF subfamily
MAAAVTLLVMQNERDLVAAVRGGDQAACRHFVERYQGPVRALARRLAPDPDQAEDLAQESFLQAFEALSSWRCDGSLSGWLCGIVRNQSRLLWRREARRKRVLRDGLANYIEHIACEELPMDPLVCEERLVALRSCLEQVNERGRRLLELRHRHDLRCDQVAETVGAKASAVRTALCRLHRRLHDCVSRRLDPELLDV